MSLLLKDPQKDFTLAFKYTFNIKTYALSIL